MTLFSFKHVFVLFHSSFSKVVSVNCNKKVNSKYRAPRKSTTDCFMVVLWLFPGIHMVAVYGMQPIDIVVCFYIKLDFHGVCFWKFYMILSIGLYLLRIFLKNFVRLLFVYIVTWLRSLCRGIVHFVMSERLWILKLAAHQQSAPSSSPLSLFTKICIIVTFLFLVFAQAHKRM